MKKILKSFIVTLLVPMSFPLHAQINSHADKESRMLEGRVYDYITNEPIFGGDVFLLSAADSSEVSQGFISHFSAVPNSPTTFHVSVDKPGDYLIRLTHPHYQTYYLPVTVKWRKRERNISVSNIEMKRIMVADKEVHLDEVTVRATKLKFYFNKDTLIYNAAAFMTQKGMVLEEILKKMPGLEIKSNGEILSNGRKVDALLLNGKDFFNRDRKTLLENLPAFMVKDVKVFDKKKDKSTPMQREQNLEGLVMDVRLKKEYEKVVFGNTDLGYGTDGRYYAKIAGVSFSPTHRLSSFFTTNNINRLEFSRGNAETYADDIANGELVSDKCDISYNVDHPRGAMSADGTLVMNYWDGDNRNRKLGQMFYPSGDIFSRSTGKERDYSWRIITAHNFHLFESTPLRFQFSPYFNYEASRTRNTDFAATFDRDCSDMPDNVWTDSLLTEEQQNALRLYGITRDKSLRRTKKHSLDTGGELTKEIRIPHTEDVLRLRGKYQFTEDKDRLHTLQDIEYFKTADHTFTNQYAKTSQHTRLWNGEANYDMHLNDKHMLSLNYGYTYRDLDNDRPIFALHQLAGWDRLHGGDGDFLLPSHQDMLSVLDRNSYSYEQSDHEQVAAFNYNYKLKHDTYFYGVRVNVPLNILKRELSYHRTQYDTIVSRRMTRPDFSIDLSRSPSIFPLERELSFGVHYRLSHRMPSLYSLVNMTDDSNPLYVSQGNPGLKDLTIHEVGGNIYGRTKKNYGHRLDVIYRTYQHQLASSQRFDRQTGITYTTPINVSGNRSLEIHVNNDLFKHKEHRINNAVDARWNRSADYMSTNLDVSSVKSVVKNLHIEERLTYSGLTTDTKMNFELTGLLSYNRSTSQRPGFEPLNYYIFGVIGKLNWELPANWKFETDARTISQRGFAYSEMNYNRVLWNASVKKSFGEKLAFKLEAYDILNQRKLAGYYVNAQGRTETFNNRLRSYVMLHAIFKLNTQKRNQPNH